MDKKSVVFRWIVTRIVARSLTGRAADLARLIRLARRVPTTVAARRFFDTLESALSRGGALGELFLRIGRQISPPSRRRIAGNLIYNEFIVGYRIRSAHSVGGNWVPGFFVMSPTMRCTLSCRGCYSAIYPREETLGFDEMDRILVVPAGHENADAIVRDPRAVAWADAYAARMAELTEPEWDAIVSDPDSRWYREGPEYRDYLRPPVLFHGERPADGNLQPIVPPER